MPTEPTERRIELAEWEDARVQRVYAILCDDAEHKPDEEHWEGYCARWIVGELLMPIAEIQALRDVLATQTKLADATNNQVIAKCRQVKELMDELKAIRERLERAREFVQVRPTLVQEYIHVDDFDAWANTLMGLLKA